MAGSSNFLQWNPGSVNQDTDGAYAADSTRSGGAVDPQIFPSALANKAFYQWSIFVAAFCQMMANKGFVMSDANYANLIAALANVITTADQPVIDVVTFNSAMALNASGIAGFYIAMTSNCGFTLIGLTEWQEVKFMWKQNGTGNNTVAFPSNVVGFSSPDPTPNATTYQVGKVFPDGKLHAIGAPVSS